MQVRHFPTCKIALFTVLLTDAWGIEPQHLVQPLLVFSCLVVAFCVSVQLKFQKCCLMEPNSIVTYFVLCQIDKLKKYNMH